MEASLSLANETILDLSAVIEFNYRLLWTNTTASFAYATILILTNATMSSPQSLLLTISLLLTVLRLFFD